MPPKSTLTPEVKVQSTFDESVRIIKPSRKGEGFNMSIRGNLKKKTNSRNVTTESYTSIMQV
jgi:hypothetical protein